MGGMDALLDHLAEGIEHTRAMVRSQLGGGQIVTATDEQVVRALTLAAELQRLTDTVLVEATGECRGAPPRGTGTCDSRPGWGVMT